MKQTHWGIWLSGAGVVGMLVLSALPVAAVAQTTSAVEAPAPEAEEADSTPEKADAPCQGIKNTRPAPPDAKFTTEEGAAGFTTTASSSCNGINPNASRLKLSSRRITPASGVSISGECKGDPGTVRFLAHQDNTLGFSVETTGGAFEVDLPFDKLLVSPGAVTLAAVCPDGSMQTVDAIIVDE
ncbi:MAG: hypothetical protein CMN28_14350 [Salinisphaeraceae bacterium]|nr:hypothetical protein [Salinisphaeraceae bacterium]